MTDEEALAAVDAAVRAGDTETLTRLAELLDAEDAARHARLTRPAALAESAAYYAAHGLPVFPLVPGGKRPGTAHGLHDATTDPDRVAAWWRATPQANIGLPTGDRFDVVDVDGPPGYASLARLRESGLLPEPLATAATPRGRHLYVAPAGAGNTTGTAPGVDYRGRGGYVVAPPSRHAPTGRAWQWLQPLNLPARP